MAREFIVVWAGKHDREPWRGLCEDFAARIRRTIPIREVIVRTKRADDTQRLELEAEAIRAALPNPCLRVALDQRGRSMTSEAFAAWLEQRHEQFPHPIAFVLGSDLGLLPALRAECELTLAFGPMTFPHEMARLMLFEQLYRALAIRQGIKYHRDPI